MTVGKEKLQDYRFSDRHGNFVALESDGLLICVDGASFRIPEKDIEDFVNAICSAFDEYTEDD